MLPNDDADPGEERWPWASPDDDGGADHLLPGLRLPDVALPSTQGQSVSLGAIDEPAVVFIYPYMGKPGRPDPPGWDDIAGAHGSTAQAEGFADNVAAFKRIGFEICGLSSQPFSQQCEVAQRLGLPYALLNCGEGGCWLKSLALPTFKAGADIYMKRLTLVVSRGKIDRVFYPVHPPHTHARALLRILGKEADR